MTAPLSQTLHTSDKRKTELLEKLNFTMIDISVFVQHIQQAMNVAVRERIGGGTNVARLSFEKQHLTKELL